MKIFTLNRGSSSIKCCLFSINNSQNHVNDPLWEAHLQWKNDFDEASFTIRNQQGPQHSEKLHEKDAGGALRHLISFLVKGKAAVIGSLQEIDVIGHRIVHGGKFFHKSTRIDADVKEKIRLLSELAPLHNLPELESIELMEHIFPSTPQIAMFDTAFHHTMPLSAQLYPGPYQWYEEGIRRYGFHGISFQYCTRRCGELLNTDLKGLKIIICHLGSGASLCAIQDGQSIDTTMGFTPLEGLMMDTRSGSVDPGIILHFLMNKKRSVEEISQELYMKSGLLGLSGASSDMRDIIEKSLKGNPRAMLAFEVYLHRLSSCIGSMIASLKGIDVLVFTAGIGENSALLRKKTCDVFSFLGIQLDDAQNDAYSDEDKVLSTPSSRVKVFVIHTHEDVEIARECWKINNGK